ncbi:MAG: RNA polymerase sigma factor [Candidatus Falkowbacteria bacterium]
MNSEEQKLITDYFSGDTKSLDLLIAKYLDVVYRLVFCYVKNAADADDLTQEVFVKVWQHLKSFDQAKSFKNWVLAIAKNTALDFLRKKKDLPLATFNDEYVDNLLNTLISAEIAPGDLLDFNAQVDTVKQILEAKSSDYWKIFSLHNFGGFNFRQIALKTGKPLNTIKSQYRRALLLIKNQTR